MCKRPFWSLLLFLIYPCFLFGQTDISGSIHNRNKQPIGTVSVILQDSLTSSILSYTYSNPNGQYQLEVDQTGDFLLVFSSMGYASKKIPISIEQGIKKLEVNAILTEKSMQLNEVIVQADRPMVIKEDTIVFSVKHFLRGNEETVEDLLKNIPGINIASDGTIKIGNKEIEKLMVEGDDFFGKGYEVLSKSMPAQPIEKVEILQNYSNNRLFKGIEKSNKVALNLKLKDEAKSIWFGNLQVGSAPKSRYEVTGNLMNFSKKDKYYFLAKANNIGNDIAGGTVYKVNPFAFQTTSDLGNGESTYQLIHLAAGGPNLDKKRTNFNNAELLSLNAIFHPTKKLELKTKGFFHWDETDFYRFSQYTVNTQNTQFSNTEDYHLSNAHKMALAQLDFTYDISKTRMLKGTTLFNYRDYQDAAQLLFNGKPTLENLQTQKVNFDQKISYTNKFEEQQVFMLTGRFKTGKAPQNYSIDRFLFEVLFPTAQNTEKVRQRSQNKMLFAGFEAMYLNRMKNEDLFKLELGNTFRKDALDTRLLLLENEKIIQAPTGFQNDLEYQANDLYLKSKYDWDLGDFSLFGALEFHQLFNQLTHPESTKKQEPFFVNPTVGLGWKINKSNKFGLSYSYNTTNTSLLDAYDGYILQDFRSFSKGTGGFDQLKASSLYFNYVLGSWTDRFFANMNIMYVKNHDFLSTNTIIAQNYSLSEKILIKDRSFFSINSQLNYYFSFLSSNFKLKVNYSESEFKNKVNNDDLRKVISKNYGIGFTLRSAFSGVFNYHIGTKWTFNEIESNNTHSFTNNKSFLDLNFVFSSKFTAQLQTERYYFGGLETNNTYYFLDVEARYKLIKNKLTLGLIGNNLLNTKKFKSYSISDISTSTVEYRLLPKMLMLSLKYRF